MDKAPAERSNARVRRLDSQVVFKLCKPTKCCKKRRNEHQTPNPWPKAAKPPETETRPKDHEKTEAQDVFV